MQTTPSFASCKTSPLSIVLPLGLFILQSLSFVVGAFDLPHMTRSPSSGLANMLSVTDGYSQTVPAFFFKLGSCYIAQTGPELMILLPLSPECKDNSSVPILLHLS
jgi:hypothetical protein